MLSFAIFFSHLHLLIELVSQKPNQCPWGDAITLGDRGPTTAPNIAASAFEIIFPLKEPSKCKTRSHFLFLFFSDAYEKAFIDSVKESRLCNIIEMFSKVYHHIKCHKTYFIRCAMSSKELFLQDLKSYEIPKREYWRSHFNLYHLYVCKLFVSNVLPLPIKYIKCSSSLES